MARRPEMGDRVKALFQPYGDDREITGTVVEVLDTQFIVQEDLDPKAKHHYPWDNGYRFIMNKDQWEVIE